MYTFTSHRIGNRASESNNHAASSESAVLRSLFELRKTQANNDEDDVATQHLTFWNCKWSPRIVQSLRKILVRDGRRFASIKFFDCDAQSDANSKDEFFAEILGMILSNDSTTSLIIRGEKLIGSDDYSQSTSSCGSTLSSCSSASIANALKEGLSVNTGLKSLTLSGLNCSSACAVNHLSDALCQNSSLESLNLRQSSLDDASIAQIVRSVQEHPTLTSLNLSRNYLGARNSNAATSPSSTVALEAVAELLRSNVSKLECLDISHQYQLHATTTTLPTQSLSEEFIQQHRVAFGNALDALSTNQTLKKIDLSANPGCLEDSSSANALATCLAVNACLKHADISGCGMTEQGASTLIETGLSKNVTLESLGDVESESIQHILNLNKGGRRVLKEEQGLPLAGWSHVFARAGNLDYESGASGDAASVLFSLLRQGPILFEH